MTPNLKVLDRDLFKVHVTNLDGTRHQGGIPVGTDLGPLDGKLTIEEVSEDQKLLKLGWVREDLGVRCSVWQPAEQFTHIPKWVKKAVSAAKQRARKKGIPFEFTPADAMAQWDTQKGCCYWFKVPMSGLSPHHPMTPSLDRVRGDFGYTAGNVVWACLAANSAKSDTDPDAWEEFLDLLADSLRNQ